MNTALRLIVLEDGKEVFSHEAWEPIIIGRQTGHDPKPPTHRIREQKCRVVLAGRDSSVLSREHLLIEAQGGGRIRVTNESKRHGITLPNRVTLKSRESQELTLPASIAIANWVVRVELPDAEAAPLRALEFGPPSPLASIAQRVPFASVPARPEKEDDAEFFLRLLELGLTRLQAAADPKVLFEQALYCLTELLEMDSVWAFLLEEGAWAVKATARRGDIARDKAGEASRFVLDKVRADKRTFWLTSQTVGLGVLPSVAAAPLLNPRGEVIGALYGHRLSTSESARVPISRLLALTVEVLAGAVSSGLLRTQASAAETPGGSFPEFFPPQVAKRIADAPHLLDDREQDIALLECEIRDFDALASKMAPGEAAQRLQEILDPISECVGAHQGVLSDFHDARVRAFWGAPVPQSDSLTLAARAAAAMLERLPDFGKRWQRELGRPLELGIAIHFGKTSVGRRGSRARFKYGPWNSAWTLVELMQQAGRVLRLPIVISAAARKELQQIFASRRLGNLEGAGWGKPLELYEIIQPSSTAFAIRENYEEALSRFENGDFDAAAQRVGKILADHPNDVPAYLLQMRTIQAKLHQGAAANGVLKLLDAGA